MVGGYSHSDYYSIVAIRSILKFTIELLAEMIRPEGGFSFASLGLYCFMSPHCLLRCLSRRWAAAGRLAIAGLSGAVFLATVVGAQIQTVVSESVDGWMQVASPFAWRATLKDVPAAIVLRRVSMPMQLYETTAQVNLSDVRVVDARGRIMQYAWIPREDAQPGAHDVPVPVHVLHGAANQDPRRPLPLDVQRRIDGTVIDLTVPGSIGRGKTEIGAVLDLTGLHGEIQAVVFEHYESDSQVHAFVLEASDTLKDWQTLRQEAHIVRLTQAGQVVQQNRVDIAPLSVTAARYLRLRWYEPASAPHLRQVAVRLTPAPAPTIALNWTEPLVPAGGGDRDFQYIAPPAMPIERLRINLPRANVIAPIRVYSYDAAALEPVSDAQSAELTSTARAGQAAPLAPIGTDHWRLAAHAVTYRMQADVGEIVSPDMLLSGKPMARFRVLIDATRRLDGTPTVQIGFTPRALVFIAQGEGPYSLAWGAAALPDAALPFENLSGGIPARAWLETVATVYPEARQSADGMMLIQPAPSTPMTAAVTHYRLTGPGLTVLLLALDLWLVWLVWRAWRRMRHATLT